MVKDIELAILFADVVGSTRLFDNLGDRRIWLILPLFGVLAAVGYGGVPKLVSGQGRLGRANR